MTTGRRKEVRYQAVEDIFAVTKSSPGLLGNILDISSRGLSFHCLANGEFSPDTFEVDLFFSKSGYLTKKLSCRKVFERTEHSQIPFSSLMMRRIGVSFIRLNPNQNKQVAHFINHLTTGQVTDRRCGLDRRSKRTNLTANHPSQLDRKEFLTIRDRRQKTDRRFPIS